MHRGRRPTNSGCTQDTNTDVHRLLLRFTPVPEKERTMLGAVPPAGIGHLTQEQLFWITHETLSNSKDRESPLHGGLLSPLEDHQLRAHRERRVFFSPTKQQNTAPKQRQARSKKTSALVGGQMPFCLQTVWGSQRSVPPARLPVSVEIMWALVASSRAMPATAAWVLPWYGGVGDLPLFLQPRGRGRAAGSRAGGVSLWC